MSKVDEIKQLVNTLNEANHFYYNVNHPIFTDSEYDSMYDKLLKLEEETGVIFSNSPTQRVGYEVVSELNKVVHSEPLLSLNKTKDIDELKKFIGDKECVLMLKMDGLTTKNEYLNKSLYRGSTRGSGTIGEEITHTVVTYKNIPLKIEEDLTVIGESIITFNDFNEINSQLSEDEKYSNQRNLASGSVRQLDSSISKKRNIRFIAFGMQNDDSKTKDEQLKKLKLLGFEVVPYTVVNKDNVEANIDILKQLAEELDYPIDGLVICYNDLKYGELLGYTSKHPRHSLAFKFGDTEYETTFTGLELNTTRTGQVSLVGLFEPVDIEGVTVTKASLHNVDIFESLELGIGDTITVRRANMVIPQIMDNLTRYNTMELPSKCPCCNSELEVRKLKDARFLYCPNDNCSAKLTQRIVHFSSRDALNIVGLSEATVERFIQNGYLKSIIDLFYLETYKSRIVKLDGFGLKSYNKLIKAIDDSTETEFANFIYGLGIPNCGKSTSKSLAKHFDKYTLPNVTLNDLLKLDDIGEVVANKIVDWFSLFDNKFMYEQLIEKFNFKQPEQARENKLEGKVFVVTGSVYQFKNRKELQKRIEDLGGKVSSSVSKGTDYLINNDAESSSSKNVSAKKLGVPIINEDQFIELIK